MDRRIQKSRKVIMDALIALLGEKDFDKITINEIADYANVNRGTVYCHFTDKFDLLDQCVQNSLDQLGSSCTTLSSCKYMEDTITYTFEYMEKNAGLYRTLLKQSGAYSFHSRLMSMLLQRFDEQIDMDRTGLNVKKDILIQFVVSAIVGVAEWWFMNDMPYPPKDMSQQLLQLVTINQVFS